MSRLLGDFVLAGPAHPLWWEEADIEGRGRIRVAAFVSGVEVRAPNHKNTEIQGI